MSISGSWILQNGQYKRARLVEEVLNADLSNLAFGETVDELFDSLRFNERHRMGPNFTEYSKIKASHTEHVVQKLHYSLYLGKDEEEIKNIDSKYKDEKISFLNLAWVNDGDDTVGPVNNWGRHYIVKNIKDVIFIDEEHQKTQVQFVLEKLGARENRPHPNLTSCFTPDHGWSNTIRFQKDKYKYIGNSKEEFVKLKRKYNIVDLSSAFKDKLLNEFKINIRNKYKYDNNGDVKRVNWYFEKRQDPKQHNLSIQRCVSQYNMVKFVEEYYKSLTGHEVPFNTSRYGGIHLLHQWEDLCVKILMGGRLPFRRLKSFKELMKVYEKTLKRSRKKLSATLVNQLDQYLFMKKKEM